MKNIPINQDQTLTDPLHPQLIIHLLEPNEKLEKLKIKSLIDTGFDEYLAIPDFVAKSLNLVEKSLIQVNLGEGSCNNLPVAEILMKVSGFEQEILVDVIITQDEEAIIGTKILELICRENQVKFCLDFINSKIGFEKV
jgi:clan AA aspartic protease